VSSASQLLRDARRSAGLSQAQLAARAGTSQPAVARAERPGSNPRFSTLAALLGAAGMQLAAGPAPLPADVDASLVSTLVAATPAERVLRFQGAYDLARRFSAARAAR
jgi:uncharacterized protein